MTHDFTWTKNFISMTLKFWPMPKMKNYVIKKYAANQIWISLSATNHVACTEGECAFDSTRQQTHKTWTWNLTFKSYFTGKDTCNVILSSWTVLVFNIRIICNLIRINFDEVCWQIRWSCLWLSVTLRMWSFWGLKQWHVVKQFIVWVKPHLSFSVQCSAQNNVVLCWNLEVWFQSLFSFCFLPSFLLSTFTSPTLNY